MSDFDMTNYLQRHLKPVDTNKIQELNAASVRKVAALQDYSNQLRAEQEASKERNAESWVSNLGLDPNGFVGSRINDIASFVSGTTRVAGQVGSLPTNMAALIDSNLLTQEEYDAYNRHKAGQATEADKALLTGRRIQQTNSEAVANEALGMESTGLTPMEMFQYADETRQVGRDVTNATDLSNIVHQSKRDKLVKDLTQRFDGNWGQTKQGASALADGDLSGLGDLTAGLGKLIYDAGAAAIKNPGAAKEYILENVPQILIGGTAGAAGKAVMTASNLGYAADYYQRGIETYQKKNGGQLPDEQTRAEIAGAAASLMIAEQFSDMAQVAASKSILSGAGKAAKDASEDAVKKGFIQSLKNTGKAAGEGFLSEAPTEAYQTVIENTLEGKPTTAKEVYAAGVIGGIAGAGTTGGIRGLSEVTGSTPEKIKERITRLQTEVTKSQAFEAAVQSGDVSALLDRESNIYDPQKAITALTLHTQRDDIDVDTLSQIKGKASSIVESLESERKELLRKISPLSEAIMESTRQELGTFQEQLNALSDSDPRYPVMQELVNTLKETLDNAEPATLRKNTAAYENLNRRMEGVHQAFADFNRKQQVKPEALDIKAAVADITAPVEAGNAEAVSTKQDTVNNIINLSMATPERLDTQDALNLASAENNTVSSEQSSYLKQFAAAREAEEVLQSLPNVPKEVYAGKSTRKEKVLGIQQYRQHIMNGILTGNQKLTDQYMTEFNEFVNAQKTALDKVSPDAVAALDIIQGEMQAAYATRFQAAPAASVKDVKPAKPETKTSSQTQENSENLTQIKNARAEKQQKTENEQIKESQESVTHVESVPQQQNKENSLPEKSLSTEPQVEAETRPDLTQSERNAETQKEIEKLDKQIQELKDTEKVPFENAGKLRVLNAQRTKLLGDIKIDPNAHSGEKQDEATPNTQPNVPYTGLSVLSTYDKVKKTLTGTLHEIYNHPLFNPVAHFLSQKKTSDRHGSERPLVLQKDFLTTWLQNPELIQGFLKQDQLTDAQKTALKHISETLNAWNQELVKQFEVVKMHEDYKQQDMFQFLFNRDEEGNVAEADVEENIKTAITYAAYSWMLDRANMPGMMKPEDIAAMHGASEQNNLSQDAINILQGMDSFQDFAIAELGQIAADILGFQLNEDGTADTLSRVHSALGAHALILLEKQGLITRESLPADWVTKELGITKEFDATSRFQYVKVVRQDDKLPSLAQSIKNANYKSQMVGDKLFGTEKAPYIADIKPAGFLQEFAQKTRQLISKLQTKVIEQTQKIPHEIIPEMKVLMDIFGKDRVLEMMGAKHVDTGHLHERNIPGLVAQNRNLESQYDLAYEMLDTYAIEEEYTDSEGNPAKYTRYPAFYVAQSVWRNFRAGFDTRSLNQQASKLHRFIFTRPAWKTTIDLNNAAMVDEFEVALAAALGVKTDQTTNNTTLDQKIGEFLDKNPDIKKAAQLIHQGLDFDGDRVLPNLDIWTEEAMDTVRNVVRDAEGMQTLQALVGYAKYIAAANKFAQDPKNSKFEVTMLVGVDGKTSGPMLTHFALGAAADLPGFYTLLNRGGFYSTDVGQASHYSQFVEENGKAMQDNQDLYQNLTNNIVDTVKKNAKSPAFKAGFDAIQVFTGTLQDSLSGVITKAGRDLAKTPLTAFIFGSMVDNSVRSIENWFVDKFYSTIEDLAHDEGKELKDKRQPTLTLEKFIEATNQLIVLGEGKPIHSTVDIQTMLKNSLSEDRDIALRKGFQRVLGRSIKETMNSYFSVLLSRRDAYNKAVQAAYQISQAAYIDARYKEIQRLMEIGEIAYRVDSKTGEKIPKHELTKKQEAALEAKLKSLAPVMHTPYSLAENNLDAGLYMGKTEWGRSTSSLHESRTHIKGGVQGIHRGTGDPHTYKNLESHAKVLKSMDPGVAGLVNAIHSMDSAAMHRAITELKQSMNVHDEISHGVGTTVEAAAAINKAITEILLEYSPARQVANMLERLMVNMAGELKAGTLSPAAARVALENMVKVYNRGFEEDTQTEEETNPDSEHVAKIRPDNIAEIMMAMIVETAYQADKMRLEAFTKLASVDQYVWEGGQFTVPQSMRDQAQAELAVLSNKPSADFENAVKVITAALNKAPAKNEAYPEWMGVNSTETETKRDKPDVESLKSLKLKGQLTEKAINLLAARYPAVRAALAKTHGENRGQATLNALQTLIRTSRGEIQAIINKGMESVPKEVVSPWGELGRASIPSDPVLEQNLAAHPKAPVERWINFLTKYMEKLGKQGDEPMAPFYAALLQQLKTKVNPNLQVRYITAATPAEDVLAKPTTNSRGWYVSSNIGEEIYLLSSEFKHSGITPETMTHEIVHSALANIIASELQKKAEGKPYNKDAMALIDELSGLLVKSKEVVSKLSEKEQAQFAPALDNLQEFLAWSMTNQQFQDKVLKQFTVKHANKNNVLVTGMKKFIDTIVSLLFPKQDSRTTESNQTAMYVMVHNVAGLLNTAAENTVITEQVLAQEHIDPEVEVVNRVRNYSTHDIFAALDNSVTPVSAEFGVQLKGLLSGIVAKLHGAEGTFNEAMRNQTNTPMDIWLKALDTGKAPFASLSIRSGLRTSEQEYFVMDQVEAVVTAALQENDARTREAYRGLSRLFTEAKAKLTPADFHNGDWAKASQTEQAQAQQAYDFLFTVDEQDALPNGRSNYLARFAAFGLAHQQVNKALQFATESKKKDTAGIKSSFWQRLHSIYESLLEFLHGKVTHTYRGQPADTMLSTLVSNLVDIESRRRQQLVKEELDVVGAVESGVRSVTDTIKDTVGKMASSNLVQNSGSAFVRATGKMVRIVAEDRVEQFMAAFNGMRDQYVDDHQSTFSGILRELGGPNSVFQRLLQITKKREKERKDIITQTGNSILKAFLPMSAEENAAVTQVFVRSGFHHLMDMLGSTVGEMEALLGADKAPLQAMINRVEAQLLTIPGAATYRYYFMNQANALGHYLGAGEVRSNDMMLNAHNIASMYGTQHANTLSSTDHKQVVDILNVLITLRALQYTSDIKREHALKVLQRENVREEGDNHGVRYLLGLTKAFEKDSLERLFEGNPIHMQHGYSPEIYNPYTDIQIANTLDGQTLLERGYEWHSTLPVDPALPNMETRHLYVMRNSVQTDRITGIMSATNEHSKGSTIHNGFLNSNTAAGLENLITNSEIARNTRGSRNAKFLPHRIQDMTKVKGAFLVPVLNQEGQIVNYRYLMSAQTKDTLLERDNRVEKVVGALAGSVFDKQTTKTSNAQAVQAAHELYRIEYEREPNAYVLVGANSTDPRLKEIWQMLPKATKADVKQIWGMNGMMIRKDSVDLMFGYRKYSLSEMFDKDPDVRNQMEKMFVSVVEHLVAGYARSKLGMTREGAKQYAKRAGMVVAKTERGWQELMHFIKDVIVIRTGTVMLGNIWSNLSLLVLNGATKEIFRRHADAWKGALAWQDDSEELKQLELLLKSGVPSPAEAKKINQDILRLKDALARNPVKELMDAGLMPTIVEDLQADDNIYSYKSLLTKKTEKWMNKLNPSVQQGLHNLLISRDTQMYKKLYQATQLSDFVARYVLYQHVTTRKDNPMSKMEAIEHVTDSFVNYDIPLPRKLQFMDDMGLLMFIKYFLRIQRVLVKLVKEQPARVFGTMALNNLVELGPIVLDSSFWAKTSFNPLRSGPLQLKGALGDLATVNAATTVFKGVF